MKSAFISALVVVAASASYDACTTADYSAALEGFMQGFQYNPDATDTECYAKTLILSSKIDQLSAAAQAFDINDWAAPLYLLSEVAVANTDLFTYCQTTNFAKQLATRTNSLAGFLDLGSTIGVAFLKNYREPLEENKLYTAIMAVETVTTCRETANRVGQVLHYSFNYEVGASTYVDQLSQDLVAEIFD